MLYYVSIYGVTTVLLIQKYFIEARKCADNGYYRYGSCVCSKINKHIVMRIFVKVKSWSEQKLLSRSAGT